VLCAVPGLHRSILIDRYRVREERTYPITPQMTMTCRLGGNWQKMRVLEGAASAVDCVTALAKKTLSAPLTDPM